MVAPLSRRQFFRLRLSDYFSEVKKKQRQNSDSTRKPYIRPPGALEDEILFLKQCTKCGACIHSCPHKAIEPLGPSAGSAEHTPVISPEKTPCRWCVDMPCINACTDKALQFKNKNAIRPIGKAEINHNQCLIAKGTFCDYCVKACPSSKALSLKGRNLLFADDACLGCGLCIHACPVGDKAIVIKPLSGSGNI